MSTKSAVHPFRCSYRTAEGRQCRLLSTDPRSGLCPQHALKAKDPADFAQLLVANAQGFQTAQGINFSLGVLYKLLAANRISPRRASVLAFISSMLLRTLPAIDADQAAGVTDPTASKSSPELAESASASEPNAEAEVAQSASEAAPTKQQALATVVAIQDACRNRAHDEPDEADGPGEDPRADRRDKNAALVGAGL